MNQNLIWSSIIKCEDSINECKSYLSYLKSSLRDYIEKTERESRVPRNEKDNYNDEIKLRAKTYAEYAEEKPSMSVFELARMSYLAGARFGWEKSYQFRLNSDDPVLPEKYPDHILETKTIK